MIIAALLQICTVHLYGYVLLIHFDTVCNTSASKKMSYWKQMNKINKRNTIIMYVNQNSKSCFGLIYVAKSRAKLSSLHKAEARWIFYIAET